MLFHELRVVCGCQVEKTVRSIFVYGSIDLRIKAPTKSAPTIPKKPPPTPSQGLCLELAIIVFSTKVWSNSEGLKSKEPPSPLMQQHGKMRLRSGISGPPCLE